MTAQQFSAGSYSRQNQPVEKEEGSFNTRVRTVEGSRPQSGSRAVEAPTMGNIHRDSRDGEWKGHDLNHKPFTSMHRPEEPTDLSRLKAHQSAMLSPRSKRKREGQK